MSNHTLAHRDAGGGSRPPHHQLRTHGSVWEAEVPFVISEPLTGTYAERGAAGGLRSHEIFDFALNGPA